MIKVLKALTSILRDSFRLLKRNDPLILSSSTAFFTTFSLCPIIILLVNIFSFYSTSDKIHNRLFAKIGSAIGDEAARELQTIVANFRSIDNSWWLTALSMIFFIFVGTTLLGVVKLNIHKLWHLRRKPKKSYRYYTFERLIQLALILFTGALFMISFFIDTSLAISLDYLQQIVPGAGIILIRILNIIFSLIVITLWFTAIFKMLPEAKVDWEIAFNGGFLTAILFTFGKVVLGKILVHARFATIFGASASIALLLLFIFYCSFILYYGAAFTHEYAEAEDKHICASKYAHEYEERLIGSTD